MDVIIVGNISLKWHTLSNTIEFTLEKSPMDVISVRNSSVGYPENSHWKDTQITVISSVASYSKIADICSLCHHIV